MKKSVLIAVAITALPAIARTGATPSSALTDVQASDAIQMYAEEMARNNLLHNSKVIFINGDQGQRADRDSVESMLAKFYVDQFRNSQDPESPYFIFMSKDANFTMGVGGVISMRGWYDWNGMINDYNFSTSEIQIPKTPETKRSLGASMSSSSIFFNIMGRHTPVGDFRAYIQGGFSGYGRKGFKLKKAWIQMADFTAGLAPPTFSDPDALPETLDGAGADGSLDKNNILVRYLHTWCNHWTVAGSVELPSSQVDDSDPHTSLLRDYVPDFAFLGQYQWDRGHSHVRLAGVIRDMGYRDLTTDRNHHVLGWGAQLSSVARAGRIVTLYGTVCVGEGISAYLGDLSSGNYDLLADASDPGCLYAPLTLSGSVGAKVQILPRLASTLCLATLRHLPKANPAADTYKYGQYLSINAVYDFSPRLQLGVEYLAGKRKNCNGAEANVNRAEALLSFSF
ncbi:MAG: hypothetical protein K2G78_02115 [Muribaculaceae bacterium]|nr:hypothetical protein [Muribaculaceae bacterium]